jgi:phosphoribosylglycinamide formyltransferase-1
VRLAILLSGRGSNFEAIYRANVAEIVCVISNRPDAKGIARARELGLTAHVFDHRRYPTREAHEEDVLRAVAESEADFIALAGYMRLLSPAFVAAYPHRILNIHPSLLPAFPGLHTHRRALEAGCKLAGVTVHFVTPELDHGPIVIQAAVPVLPGDDEQVLAERVLAREHVIYPLAVRWFVEGQLRVSRGIVTQAAGAAQLLLP